MLDLDKINQLDKTKDAQKIGKMCVTAYRESYPYLEVLSKIWEYNVKFYEGDQHLYYDNTIKNYQIIPTTRFNNFIPRPVTNYILPICQTITSVFTKNRPDVQVSSNSISDTDNASAQIAKSVQSVKWEDDGMQGLMQDAVKIALLTGTVFREDSWNPNAGAKITIPNFETGEMFETYEGDTICKIWTPYDVIPDTESESYFIQATYEDVWSIKAAYSKQESGYTGMADKVQEDKDFTNLMNIRYRLKNSTGITNSYGSYNNIPGKAVLVKCYIQPTSNHPRGLFVVSANGKTLYCNDSPYYQDGNKDSWHPFSWFFWEKHPFRWHGISLVENLVSLQKRINSIDSLIMLNRMLNVSPQWLIPNGAEIPEGYINGSPNLQIHHTPGLAPTRLPGMNLSTDVWKERQDLVSQIYSLSGSNEVLNGVRPEGVNTLGGLNLLLEQSYNRFQPAVQSYEKFLEKGESNKLHLIAERYRENRPVFTKKLMDMNKDNLQVEINDFLGSYIENAIDIKVEAGSTLPKSQAYHQDQLVQLQQRGLLGDVTPNNPVANEEFLAEFGVNKFNSIINPDLVRIRNIIVTLKSINEGRSGEDLFPKIENYDNLELMQKLLEDAMKVPGFKDNKGAFKMFYDQVMQALTQKQQMMMPPSPPPMPGQGQMPPEQVPVPHPDAQMMQQMMNQQQPPVT